MRSDGSFGERQTDVSSQKPWSTRNVAEKYSVTKPAVISWKRHAQQIMSINTHNRAGKKIKRIKEAHFLELESALSVYLRFRMAYMNGSSLFRADIVKVTAKKIQNELLERWEKR